MKIYKLSNIIAIPFAAAVVFFAYQLFKDSHSLMAAWAVIPLVALVLIYLFQPQIDYWWLERTDIETDDQVLKLIERTNPFYRQLNESDKDRFHKRLILYTNGRAFTAKGMEKDTDVPLDIKYMLAQIPVSLCLGMKDNLLKDFEQIVIYKHAFPSPNHRYLHTCEVNKEDGVVIISLEHAEAAFFNPDRFFNIAWYAFAEAWLESQNIVLLNPADKDYIRSNTERITGFTMDFINKSTGFSQSREDAIALLSYYLSKDALCTHMKELHDRIEQLIRPVSI